MCVWHGGVSMYMYVIEMSAGGDECAMDTDVAQTGRGLLKALPAALFLTKFRIHLLYRGQRSTLGVTDPNFFFFLRH